MKKSNRSRYELAVASAQLTTEETYWTSRLSGIAAKSVFPHTFEPDITGDSFRTDTFHFKLTGETFERLLQLSNNSHYRLHMILSAAITTLLARYTGNNDIIIGTPVIRQDRETDYINRILALRNIIKNQNTTFKELLLQARQTMTEANEHQNYPFHHLLHQLGFTQTESVPCPLFDTAILLENIQDLDSLDSIRLGTIFSFALNREALSGSVLYDCSHYHHDTIERLVSHLSNLLDTVLFNIDVPLCAIDILSQNEREQLLNTFNDTAAPGPGETTIHALFEAQVQKTPDNIAIIKGSEKRTYEALNGEAERAAGYLRQQGVTPGTIVGIMLPPSIELVTGILGILKAGAAYLPVDVDYPPERVGYILRDSGINGCIVDDGVSFDALCGSPGMGEYKIRPYGSEGAGGIGNIHAELIRS